MTSSYHMPWNVSLHGGHSVAFCEHAHSTLEEMIQAAISRGMAHYGISEHAPRYDPALLFPEEIEMGWTVDTLWANFEAYAQESAHLVNKYADELSLLRGFEIEVMPPDTYPSVMMENREQFGFDYLVGSVHYVNGTLIDYDVYTLEHVLRQYDGLDALAVAYYTDVARMVESLRPEIVGHVDLVRKFAGPFGPVDTPVIQQAAGETLEVIRDCEAILDCNTAGYRKGHGMPYPAPWLVRLAVDMGIPFCFGDDSHSVAEVGAGISEAQQYLLENGVTTITHLVRDSGGAIDRRTVGLEAP